jgi:hypothetical protein
MSSNKQFFGIWAVVGGYLALLFLLIIVQGILDITNLLPLRLSVIPFMVLHLILLVAFFIVLFRTISPSGYQEAEKHGEIATAEVLAIKETGWRSPGNQRTSLTIRYSLNGRPLRPYQYEYELQLRVMPANATPYETKVTTFLATADVPLKGATLPVKIHLKRPDIVVLVV